MRIEVFDTGGRLVTRLVERNLPSGPHVMAWDAHHDAGERLGSGLYFVRLETVSGTQVERILIMH